MTDRMTVLTANGKLWVFDHAQLAKTDTLGDCDNDRQLEIAICTFCSPTLQFLAVGRCRNHLANLLSSSSSSNIPNLALEFRRYLPEFQRCNYFWFWRPYRYFRLSVAVVLICQLTAIHGLIPQICRWTFNCTFHNLIDMYLRFRPPFPIVGHYWNRLDTLPGSCELAVVECRRFAVGILMICVIVSETLLLPVRSWISSTHRRPTKTEVPPLESLTPKRRCSRGNFDAVL